MCGCPYLLIFTFLDHEELDFEEVELSKNRCERVQLKPKGDTPNIVNTYTINLHWWALNSMCTSYLSWNPHIRSGSWADYKGWISENALFPLSLIPQVFPMAETAIPYSFGQDDSAIPQYEDPEKASVNGEKVFDSGYWK